MGSPNEQIRPRLFILQFHLTERCNLKCAHCYQTEYASAEMNLDQAFAIVSEFARYCLKKDYMPQVTFTGGEPFVLEGFVALLHRVRQAVPSLRIAILTNGTLITPILARELSAINPVFVQISIDGAQQTHDALRGVGMFQKSLACIALLQEHGIRTLVSFTAHQGNYSQFPDVVKESRNVGASNIWTDRLIPVGSGGNLCMLSPQETRQYFEIVRKEQIGCLESGGVTRVDMNRALQALVGQGHPYRCTAGRFLLAVLPDGTVYPCRRLPIPVGNCLDTSLARIRRQAKLVVREAKHCKDCELFSKCHGGLRCLAYAVRGDLTMPDPGCWHYNGNG